MEHLDPELLSAYIDHELPAADMAAVERHLAACDTCRAEYEELRGLSTLVRELPVYQPKRVIDVSAHPRGGSDTLAKIIAFSKPLAIAAVLLLVAFAGLRLLTDDEPDDGGDQISFSAVQPTEAGTEVAREASEDQAQDASFAEAPADSESMSEPPPPMGAMPARQSQTQATTEVVASAPEQQEAEAMSTPTPEPTAAATPAPAMEPEPVGEGNRWLPVAIVAAAIVALAGGAGWYRFVRPRRHGT